MRVVQTHMSGKNHPPVAIGLERAAFERAVAHGAAHELSRPLSAGWKAIEVSTGYMDKCWSLVPKLDQHGLDELVETASMITADLYLQRTQRSA